MTLRVLFILLRSLAMLRLVFEFFFFFLSPSLTHSPPPSHFPPKYKVCRALIESGSALEAKDKNGETPLDKALDRNRIGASSVLVELGAEVIFLLLF